MLAAAILVLACSPERASAVDRTWDAGASADTSWTNATNWNGDTLPATGDRLLFGSSGTTATLNTNLTYNLTGNAPATSVIIFTNAANSFTISGTGTLTLSSSSSAITADSTTAGLRGTIGVMLVGNTRMDLYGNNSSLQISGGITMTSGNLYLRGASGGTLAANAIDTKAINLGTTALNVLSGSAWQINVAGNTWGSTAVSGTLKMGASNALAGGASGLTLGAAGILDLNGNSQSIGGLSGTAGGDIKSASAATLTVTNGSAANHAGTLSGAGLALTKTGASNLELRGNNTYGGLTTVNAGYLDLGNTNALGSTAVGTVVNGATIRIGTVTAGLTYAAEQITLNNGGSISSYGNGDTLTGGIVLGTGGTNTIASANGTAAVLNITGGITTTGTSSLAFNSTITGNGSHITNNVVNIGTGALIKQGTGVLSIDVAGNTWGATTIENGTLKMGVANALPSTTGVTLGATGASTLDLNGYSQTVTSLTKSTQAASVTSASAATLTINVAAANQDYAGSLDGAGLALTIGAGANNQRLSASNSYGGLTTVNGMLDAYNINAFGASGSDANGTVVNSGRSARIVAAGTMAEWFTLNEGILVNYTTNTYSGRITLGTGSNAMINLGTTLDVTGGIATTGTSNLKFDTGTSTGTISTTAANIGTGALIKQGAGTLNMNVAGNTWGATTIENGTLKMGVANALPSTTAVTLGATAASTLDLNGYSQTVASLTKSTSAASVTSATAATLTVSNSANSTYSGTLQGAGLALTKAGAGTVTLSGSDANTFAGVTTVSGGTLELNKTAGVNAIAGATVVNTGAKLLVSASNQVDAGSNITLSGGTIERASGVSEVFGNLAVNGTSFLDFGTGTAGNLTFGTYAPSSLLTVNNFFQGNTLVFGSNLTSSIAIGTYNTTSYTSTDGMFTINSISGGFTAAYSGSTFTITAIPEPSTLVAALGLAGLMLWPLRCRFSKSSTNGVRS